MQISKALSPVFPAGLTWVVDTQSQRDSTLVTVVEAVAGDGHCTVDDHLVLLTVLCYVERVWRKLKRGKRGCGEFGWAGSNSSRFSLSEWH